MNSRAVCQIFEKVYEFRHMAIIVFVDFKAVFDLEGQNFLWFNLQRTGKSEK